MKNFFRKHYQKTVESIAFYPAIIAVGFLLLCALMISLDYSQTGKLIKSELHWLRLKDATTARSIIGAIASGILSLTVFSFSMVMIVLNQAASQMSNRVLGQLIGNKFQQIILGIYIGTIIYAFFLLSTIRDIDSGIYIPALSTYLLIFFTILDIFIFIYFLHYITQSVKYEVVIQRIFDDTLDSLKNECSLKQPSILTSQATLLYKINSRNSGIFESIDRQALKSVCIEHNLEIAVLITPGTFVLAGIPVLAINKQVSEKVQNQIIDFVSITLNQTIQGNFFYGFNQLRETALRALSPGINDPGTAVISLHALASLILYRAEHFPDNIIRDDHGLVLITIPEIPFETIVCESINPIWDYGKNDRLICKELHSICLQLKDVTKHKIFTPLLHEIDTKLNTFLPRIL